jgi:transcriptional regulator with XRE-family HTH domain
MASSSFSPRRLRAARCAAGLTPEHLAIATGRSFYTIAGWERGRVTPPTAVLPVIADVLGVQIADLFEDSGPDAPLAGVLAGGDADAAA